MENENEMLKKLNQIARGLERLNMLKKEVLTFNEAHEYLDLSRSYLYKLTSSKTIPHYCPCGKKLYFKRSELDKWILKNAKVTNHRITELANQFSLRESGNPRD